MLVPAGVLFAFGILVFFCLIPSPDQIGKSIVFKGLGSFVECTLEPPSIM